MAAANSAAARRAERRYPPRGRFIEVDGVRLHYLEAGAGPAVVLLHGNGAHAEDFAVSGLIEELAQRHRVLAFDRPGFGFSERPRGWRWTARAQGRLLLHALWQLGVERPLLVGHSWGALVAASMALDAPGDVSGLVLISGYYRPTPRADVLLLSGPAIPIMGDVLSYTVSPLMGRAMTPAVLKLLFSPAPGAAEFGRRFPTALALRPSQLRATAADTAYMVPEAARLFLRLRRLEAPVLAIAGADDKFVSTKYQTEWLASHVPHAQLVILPGGHMIHHTAAAQVASAIEDFAAHARADLQDEGAPATVVEAPLTGLQS